MARSITIPPPAAFRSWRTRCSKCGAEVPVTGLRVALTAITVESQCAKCKTVNGREYSLTGRSTHELLTLDFVQQDPADAAFDRILGGGK